MPPPPAHLGRTMPVAAFDSTPPTAATGPSEAAAPEPTLERGSLSAPGQHRFAVAALLGAGATSRVFAIDDRDLERQVAIKLVEGEPGKPQEPVQRLLQEARITASLTHPNVLPIHDVDVDQHGRVFMTMARIDGRSLGALIELAGDQPAITDANQLTTVFIGVCQALAYAHRRGVVHQDIKPDNVMLGEFGEVLVVDWGSAVRGAADPAQLYGTPLYMSPEQARRERADARSDVYAIGASLFHVLTGRLPTWHDDQQEFWRRKCAGTVDAPTAVERARAPAALLAIASKALAVDARERYADAGGMLEDLRRYQSGFAVSALHETPWQAFRRWHRRHGRALWTWNAVAAVVLVLGAALWWQRLEEMAHWGRPVVVERFDDGTWRDRWLPMHGSFEHRDGRIVSGDADGMNMVMLARPLQGTVALEYEAEMLPGHRRCDISALWARDLVLTADGTRVERLVDQCTFQLGAFDGAYSRIDIRDGDRRRVVSSDFQPEPGRRYRVRVEVDDRRLSFAVDGVEICEWLDPFSYSGGYIGLYGHYDGKAFDEVRVYEREPPRKVSVTAIGDAMARAGHLDSAVIEYAKVASTYASTALGREALYRQGLCRWRQERIDDAFAIWSGIADGDEAGLVEVHRAERLAVAGDHVGAMAALERVHAQGGPLARRSAIIAWCELTERARQQQRHDALEVCLSARRRFLRGERLVDTTAAEACLDLGYCQEVLDEFPRQRWTCSRALMELGRMPEVIADYPDQEVPRSLAAFYSGRYDLLELLRPDHPLRLDALWKQGRLDEVLAHPNEVMRQRALLAQGRLEEVVAADPQHYRGHALILLGRAEEALPDEEERALIALGRIDDLLRYPHRSAGRIWVPYHLAMRRWAAGDHAGARAILPDRKPRFMILASVWFMHSIAFPVLEAVDAGDRTAIARASAELEPHWTWIGEQVIWHDLAFVTGRIDERRWREQPCRVYVDGRAPLVRALRAELEGRPGEALAHYREWEALPRWKRGDGTDATIDLLVASRIARLQ